jgi:choline kinase
MRALILAAGRGSRLHPYPADCPKCLTELGGRSLLSRQIEALRGAGADDIVIATGYRAEALALPGTRQVHNADWETTNMVETLFCAEALFGDDLIVSYSDIVYETRVVNALLDSPHDISVVIDTGWRAYWEIRFENPLDDAESLRLDAAGRIIDIGSKVDNFERIEAQYIGLMRFRGAGIRALRDAYAGLRRVRRPWMTQRPVEKAYMTDLLMEIILTGNDVYAVPVANGWLEIDTVSDFETAVAMFADGTIRRFFDPVA